MQIKRIKFLGVFILLVSLTLTLAACDTNGVPDQYTLTINHDGQGTTSPSEGQHEKDTDSVVNITVDPDDGWEFYDWMGPDGDDVVLEDDTYKITMDADKEITSAFKPEGEEVVSFEDENLELAVREEIDKAEGILYTSDVIDIEILDVNGRGIESIEGIQYLKNLISLDMGTYFDGNDWHYNYINDISALSELTKLKYLDFRSNEVSNIEALENLINLEELIFTGNEVSDIDVIQSLDNLNYLHLGFNNVSNINAVGDLTNLEALYIWTNQISDISALKNLTNLEHLGFANNQVSDITVLENLTELKSLYFFGNKVSDISVLSNLTNLMELDFMNNEVSDISVLENLIELRYLAFENNEVSDISPLSNLTKLRELRFMSNEVSDISPLVDNDGFGDGDFIDMSYNYIDLTEDMDKIQELKNRGVAVVFDPQRD